MAEETKKVETTEEEIVRPITLTDTETGAKYTLEFNREAVKFAEDRGFRLEDVPLYPVSKIPELFFYAFRMHHKNIARDKTDKMLTELGGIDNLPEEFFVRLRLLYEEAVNSLFGKVTENPRITVEL